ncbi:hypothetical protein Tco_1193950 [Tanacetum coccineum]
MEPLTHRWSVTTSLWEVPKMKKPTMPIEITEEEDIKESTMVGFPGIGETINQEMKTKTLNLERTPLPFHQLPKRSSMSLTINVPIVDVLAGMSNYGKFLKDLVSNKSKMEQISAAFLNKECSIIVQNKLPPKMGDPGSFLILCIIAGSVEYLALADHGASINLMPYLLYDSLSGNTLKPTRMSIHLANHTYQYSMGIAENMLV